MSGQGSRCKWARKLGDHRGCLDAAARRNFPPPAWRHIPFTEPMAWTLYWLSYPGSLRVQDYWTIIYETLLYFETCKKAVPTKSDCGDFLHHRTKIWVRYIFTHFLFARFICLLILIHCSQNSIDERHHREIIYIALYFAEHKSYLRPLLWSSGQVPRGQRDVSLRQ
jgi:hypothetical protein